MNSKLYKIGEDHDDDEIDKLDTSGHDEDDEIDEPCCKKRTGLHVPVSFYYHVIAFDRQKAHSPVKIGSG